MKFLSILFFGLVFCVSTTFSQIMDNRLVKQDNSYLVILDTFVNVKIELKSFPDNSEMMKLENPKFPHMAEAIGIHGRVTVEIKVDEVGKVTNAKSISGHPALRQPTIDSVKESIFVPTLKKYKAIIVYCYTVSGEGGCYSDDRTKDKPPASSKKAKDNFGF